MLPFRTHDGHLYPVGYRFLLANGVRALTPWRLADSDAESARLREIAEYALQFAVEEQQLHLYPFASTVVRGGEYAAFALKDGRLGDTVYTLDLSESDDQPRPDRRVHLGVYRDVWSWILGEVLDDMREWSSEEDLADLLERRAGGPDNTG